MLADKSYAGRMDQLDLPQLLHDFFNSEENVVHGAGGLIGTAHSEFDRRVLVSSDRIVEASAPALVTVNGIVSVYRSRTIRPTVLPKPLPIGALANFGHNDHERETVHSEVFRHVYRRDRDIARLVKSGEASNHPRQSSWSSVMVRRIL